jgi:hypothetical protein
MTSAGLKTPLAGSGIYEWASGNYYAQGGWFGPGTPLAPQAPQAAGRRWDYPTAINLQYYPKRGEGISFAELRALADGYDLLRVVIETRKDEMEFLEWSVKDKGGAEPGDRRGAGPGDRRGKESAKAERIQELLKKPDREHTWHQWQRMLLEELFVTDAPSIYVRKDNGGNPCALEIVDGATIKRILDESGRTPLDGPAYQQILKGIVAAEFDRSELIYSPRNVRANKVYGYSPVEQVITTVNIALRRQAHQLSYYTEGSVPDTLFMVPESWKSEQIEQFQRWWNSIYSDGNVANRRMARFIPNGMQPINTKDAILKDQYDEWLARLICFAFSVSPQPLIAQMNRATAEVAEETAKSSGLEPIKNWLKGLMDRIICDVYGEPGLEFAWSQKEAIDPKTQAEIHAIYLGCGAIGVDEVRDETGREAREPSPRPALRGPNDENIIDAEIVESAGQAHSSGQQLAAGNNPVQDTALNGAQVSSLVQIVQSINDGILPKESAINLIQAAFPGLDEARVRGIVGPLKEGKGETEPENKGAGQPADAPAPIKEQGGNASIEKAARLPKIDHERKAVKQFISDMQTLMERALSEQRDMVLDALGTGKLAKKEAEDYWPLLNSLGISFNPYLDDIERILERAAKSGATVALNALRPWLANQKALAYTQLVNQANWKAIEWAKAASAELVTDISNSTKESLKNLIADSIERGLGVGELAAEIMEAHAFSKERAELIAVTEIAEADVKGNKIAYAESGVVTGLQWQCANGGNDERTCEECAINHGAVVPLGANGMAAKAYPSGAIGVPAHPRCICDELPVIDKEE